MIQSRREWLQAIAAIPIATQADGRDWPSFRGPHGKGVSTGHPLPTSWNADPAAGPVTGIRWKSPVPGLGHSSPVIVDGRIYVATAVRKTGKAPLKLGVGGESTAADDSEEQAFVVLAYDAGTGREVWRRTAREGQPRTTRHQKATHANTTLATDGSRLVAFFGSEGLYCYDLAGRLLWSRDLGVINVSKYGIGWGYASSPAIHGRRIALLCDDPGDPYLVVLNLDDGKEVWRVSRKGICERSWGTPLIHAAGSAVQVVANGWPWSVSYDLETGKERWRIGDGGDNPIPTPFEANGWLYLTSAHGGKAPVYAIRPEARGDLTPGGDRVNEGLVWAAKGMGAYISTPVVYGDYIYLAAANGVIRCLNARTGEKKFEERLPGGSRQIYASLVAGDGKVYVCSLEGDVNVLRAGPAFEVLACNQMGEPCFATPAILNGTVYFRTTGSLVAIG
jgi:outer membrane protein assembly factor BamB